MFGFLTNFQIATRQCKSCFRRTPTGSKRCAFCRKKVY